MKLWYSVLGAEIRKVDFRGGAAVDATSERIDSTPLDDNNFPEATFVLMEQCLKNDAIRPQFCKLARKRLEGPQR